MADRAIVLGRVSGLFGIGGWVKVHSYTRPPANILAFSHWLIGNPDQWRPFTVADTRAQGKTLVAHLADEQAPLADRDAAAALLDCDIAVARAALPALPAGQYYWVDLVGLEVVTLGGAVLGKVRNMMETGAHDVLVVHGDREHLLPFVHDEIIREVDIEAGHIAVDWDPDF
jgi:16S rRNA processing protein RimM